jgi:hypothetical protein
MRIGRLRRKILRRAGPARRRHCRPGRRWHFRPGPARARHDRRVPTAGPGNRSRTSERRPLGGAVAWRARPGYQACTYVLPGSPPSGRFLLPGPARLGSPCLGSPPAAGRAWVPGFACPDICPSTPFYDGSARLERGRRYQSVIPAGEAGHSPRLAGAPPAAVPRAAPKLRTGQPRCWASLRRARSGLTARGLPTISSMGRSVIESL